MNRLDNLWDENDERYDWRRKAPAEYGIPERSYLAPVRTKPRYMETPYEREAREHFEFGLRYGSQPYLVGRPAHPYDFAPESHRRDPYDIHYDPYEPFERLRAESRPHWTDDDEKFTMDFARQPRDIFRPKPQKRGDPWPRATDRSKAGDAASKKQKSKYPDSPSLLGQPIEQMEMAADQTRPKSPDTKPSSDKKKSKTSEPTVIEKPQKSQTEKSQR